MPSERVLEEPCEFGITKRHHLLTIDEAGNAVAKN